MKDIKEIMCPKDTQNLARLPRMQAIYDALARIAQEYKPNSVFEIGVRAGYSAYVWVTEGGAEEYIGCDMDDTAHYGGPWLPWARRLLNTLDVSWNIWEQDSQKLLGIGGPYDLIHVDGDHTYEGCLHDMNLCWPAVKPGGVMVVDDATYLPGPRKACGEWKGYDLERSYIVNSPTGSMVYVKKVTQKGAGDDN